MQVERTHVHRRRPQAPERAQVSRSACSEPTTHIVRTPASKREYLLSQIRQKDAIIESLLKQVRLVVNSILSPRRGASTSRAFPQLHNPYIANPLSINNFLLSTAPPDQQNQNVKQWLERLQASVRLPSAPNTLRNAARYRSRDYAEDALSDEDEDDVRAGAEGEDADAEWEDLDDPVLSEKLLPDAAVPQGLFAELSLDQARSTKARSDNGAEEKDGEDDDVVCVHHGLECRALRC
jgi:hypothetical protein